MFGTPASARAICRADEIYIPGEHNLRNALAAAAMAMTAGVPAPVIRHTLKTFKGVEHRIEFPRELSGVKFYNDSKGTNVDSSIQAVRAMRAPTVIILGGYDKHTDFTPLCKEMISSGWIRHAVLIGDTAAQIDRQLRETGFDSIEHAGYDFPAAIRAAFAAAEEGGNVLLSPSCASFDMFEDYEARGREFKRIVKDLEPKMG
jgi:UDP-N-acetylmuramoylalanine--D-glutamate ligase